MDSLRLGQIGLSPAEQSLVQTLFRLHRVDPSFIWSYATEAPFDALLVDVSCSQHEIDRIKGSATRVARLGPMGGDVQPGVMERPIRSDILVRWLNSIEVEILHGSHDQFASTSLESQTPQGMREMVLPSKPPSHQSEPSKPSAQVEAAPLDGRYKLRRWPSPVAMAADVSRIRMATMLSRRHLSVAELSALSRVGVAGVEEFLGHLHRDGLLDRQAAAVVAPTAMSEVGEPRSRGIGRSLIKSIRQRFGI